MCVCMILSVAAFVAVALKVLYVVSKNVANHITRPTIYVY